MPEQKFAASDANAAQLHRDGSDIGHAASHDAGHKLSQEAADLMRAQQTRGGKPKQQEQDADSTMKHFVWEMLVWGL